MTQRNVSFVFIAILCFQDTLSLKKNILLIIVDDLRPALGCYNDVNAFTPNIDELSRESIVFKNAYVQQAICAPSRNSFLTSRRPDTLHLYDFYNYWRSFTGNFTTLPQFFKERGYLTMSIGKVFHPGISSNHSDDQPYSWSLPPFHPKTVEYKNAKVCPDSFELKKNLVCPVIVNLQPGGTLPDIESTNEAIVFLRSVRVKPRPFLLALGYHKPHVPLKYPVRFREYHPLENVTIPSWRFRSPTVPLVAWNPWTDIRERDDIKNLNIPFPFGVMPDIYTKKITQSYYAAVTYVDDLIGKVISELKLLGLYENTIIAVLGDNGWSLGEHGEWSKFSNYETSVRVPLILRVPKATDGFPEEGAPNSNKELVELVDLFPTLVEASGFEPLTTCPENSNITLCTEGVSLYPLIESMKKEKRNLNASNKKTWKSGAFSQYPRPGVYPTLHPNSDKPKLKQIRIMGYSVRTRRFRYTEWVEFKNLTPNWNKTYATELYDYSIDPNEMVNLSSRPELDEILNNLSRKLRLGWRGSLPVLAHQN